MINPETPDIPSGFVPVGQPEVVAENPWFRVIRQPMDFVDPVTREVKRAAYDEDGKPTGQMNYVDINSPGVLVVADMPGDSTLLMGQERYPTNLVESRTVMHYELPGGGIDAEDNGDIDAILAAAEKELQQELGMQAGELILLGSQHRGLIAHPSVTDHNYTVLARGVTPSPKGAEHEASEMLKQPEEFTWRQTEDMYLTRDGLYVPDEGYKVISLAPIVASLVLARTWLQRNQELQSIYVI